MPPLQVQGGAGVGHRLGYGEHFMTGPWPSLSQLFRYLARQRPDPRRDPRRHRGAQDGIEVFRLQCDAE
jgi:hypothetical protein